MTFSRSRPISLRDLSVEEMKAWSFFRESSSCLAGPLLLSFSHNSHRLFMNSSTEDLGPWI